jgi:hypothetical protein
MPTARAAAPQLTQTQSRPSPCSSLCQQTGTRWVSVDTVQRPCGGGSCLCGVRASVRARTVLLPPVATCDPIDTACFWPGAHMMPRVCWFQCHSSADGHAKLNAACPPRLQVNGWCGRSIPCPRLHPASASALVSHSTATRQTPHRYVCVCASTGVQHHHQHCYPPLIEPPSVAACRLTTWTALPVPLSS